MDETFNMSEVHVYLDMTNQQVIKTSIMASKRLAMFLIDND